MSLPSPRFKLAFIGTHGVGKTTLCYGLAARLKTRDVILDIVHEVARRCPMEINEASSGSAQSWILHTQIADELAAANRHPVVICDRSVLDNYVYLLLAGGRAPALDALVTYWLSTYDRLVYVPIVDDLRADGTRSTNAAFQRAVDERVRKELDQRKLRQALCLDPKQREQWLDIVEEDIREQLETPQLTLL